MAGNNVFSTLRPQSGLQRSTVSDIAAQFEFAGLYDTDLSRYDAYRTAASHVDASEQSLISDYRRLWTESELTSGLVEYMVTEILAPYHFEGEDSDVEKVKEFWDAADMERQLEIIVREAILEGLGGGNKHKKGKELSGFQWIDASTLSVDVSDDGVETWSSTGAESVKRENLFLYRPVIFPGQNRGISFVRAAFLSLQAMDDLKRDIPAAIKNLAYETRLMKLNLSEINDMQKKKDIILNTKNLFARYDSATTTVIVYDGAMGEMGYMGTMGQQGGGQGRIIPIMGIISPIIAFLTLKFAIAQGHILQDNSNKALVDAQEVRAKRALDKLRRGFARTVEQELLRDIAGQETILDFKKLIENEPTKVRLVYDLQPEDSRSNRLVLIREWEGGIIPLGLYWEKAGFDLASLNPDLVEKFSYEIEGLSKQTRGQPPSSGSDVTEVERNNKNGPGV